MRSKIIFRRQTKHKPKRKLCSKNKAGAMQDAAMLWTCGKDSSLALCEAGLDGLRVRNLVTFASPNP